MATVPVLDSNATVQDMMGMNQQDLAQAAMVALVQKDLVDNQVTQLRQELAQVRLEKRQVEVQNNRRGRLLTLWQARGKAGDRALEREQTQRANRIAARNEVDDLRRQLAAEEADHNRLKAKLDRRGLMTQWMELRVDTRGNLLSAQGNKLVSSTGAEF